MDGASDTHEGWEGTVRDDTSQIEEIIREIATKHGIAVSRDDPILILQTINSRLMLDSAKAQQAMLDHFKAEWRISRFAIAAHAAAFQPGLFDGYRQALVFLGALAFRVLAPGIKTAGMNLKHFAQPSHWKLVL